VKNSYWMVTAIIDTRLGLTKEDLIRDLRGQAIDCRPFFYPLSSLPAYQHLEQAQQARRWNQVSYQLSPRGINLPSGFNMTEEKVRRVCSCLREILGRQTAALGERLCRSSRS